MWHVHKRVSVCRCAQKGQTVLHYAGAFGSVETVRALLDLGASVSATNTKVPRSLSSADV